MTPAPQHQVSIDYDERTRRFTIRIDGRELDSDIRSYVEAQELVAEYLRRERVIAQVKVPVGRLALTVPEVAKALRVKDTTIRDLINAGELPAFLMGRTLRVSVKALDDWIAQQEDAYTLGKQPDPSILVPRQYNRSTR